MNWIESANQALNDYRTWERERKYHLSLRSPGDVPDDCSKVKRVSLQDQFPAPSAIQTIQRIQEKALQLESISISCPDIMWDDVFSLNLEGIKRLAFSMEGEPGSVQAVSSSLKELTIFAKPVLTPLELLAHGPIHFDFSAIPALESLKLAYFQLLDPRDFSTLNRLQNLTLTEAGISDLSWLRTATYRLQSLRIDGSLEDCRDIICQPQIEKLILTHTYITDISPVEQLQRLHYLDLRHGCFRNEGHLRTKGIEKIALTIEDGDRLAIDGLVQRLLNGAARRIVADDKAVLARETVPEYHRKWLLYRVNQPLSIRLEKAIEQEFLRELGCIKAAPYRRFRSFTNEEACTVFTSSAFAFFPFLQQ